jgi:hypothetical protein
MAEPAVLAITLGCGILDASGERLEKEMFLNLSSIVGLSSWASRLDEADKIGVDVGQLGAAVVTADEDTVGPALELRSFFNSTFWCSTTPPAAEMDVEETFSEAGRARVEGNVSAEDKREEDES